MSRLSMKGLGLVLALIKKMKTGDDISITETGTETETETAPLRVKVVLLSWVILYRRSPSKSSNEYFRHAVTSLESEMDLKTGRNWHTSYGFQPLRELLCDLQHFPGVGSACSPDLCELYGTGQPAVGERQRHSNKTKVESKHGDAHCFGHFPVE